MSDYDIRRLGRHARRVEELRLWRNSREHRIEQWGFSIEGGEPRKISPGDPWPEVATPVRFRAEARVPDDWSGEEVELELWLGGEGFVHLSNGVGGGLDPFHRSLPVTEGALGGEAIGIEAEVVPKSMFGSNVFEPRLVRACLVVPDKETRALERDFSVVLEACTVLEGHEVVPRLLDALDAAMVALSKSWPTATDVTLTRYLEGYVDRLGDGVKNLPAHYAERALDVPLVNEPWSLPSAPGPLQPLPEAALAAVREARRILASCLEGIKAEYPAVGRLALTGHAHLDLAWLWPLEETRRKARRTFYSVLGLMDRYEEFTFNQSSAQLYAWVEEDDPGLFARIRERVAQGRWEPVGGSWVEPDCQIPGGESFVRQLLYGQRYFAEKFGRHASVAWLPDTFGFSPSIPQLLRSAGITGFFTYKLNWGEANKFPHDLFHWEGLDGSRIVAHSFDNPGVDYNGDVAPRDLLGTWRNFGGKRSHSESLFSFGWGDGGGGPTGKMLENYSRLRNFPALPRLRMARVDEFFAGLLEENLPAWVGELYLELHRGTLTTQGGIKKLSREAEHRLLEAEAFAAIAALDGAPYPSEDLERSWKTLLLNQFHDILPGTSIAEVYVEARRQLEEVMRDVKKLRGAALNNLCARAEEDSAMIIANAGLHPRELTVLLPVTGEAQNAVSDVDSEPLPTQSTEDGLLIHAPERLVPALGGLPVRFEGRESGVEKKVAGVRLSRQREGVVLENELLSIEISAAGNLHQVYDKSVDREVLDGAGNRLWAYVDKPREWDAWDVDEDYELEGEEVLGVESVEVVEHGPLRAAVRVVRCWRNSRIVQTYRLLSGSRRVDIATEIHWGERRVFLRALFPVNVRTHEATYETMYGAVRRPTHRNTSWEAARFEVCAHRFVDLSEPGYGVALLNDGKYGHSARGNVLGISLVRSPIYPDPRADEGYHQFTYSFFPHPGNWIEANVTGEGFALNSPLIAAPAKGGTPEFGLVEAEGLKLMLGSLKEAEDGRGIILRLYEPHGARGTSVLHFIRRIRGAERVDLLERTLDEELQVEGSLLRLPVRPFEVVTIRLELNTV